MARSAASIQAEIDRWEAVLTAEDADIRSAGADGVNSRRHDLDQITARLDKLYVQLGRANGQSPMFARGRVKGLR